MKNNLLFREYVKQLMDYGKKFIIVGNINAIVYKEIFPYIKDNKMWIGHNPISNFNLRNGGIGKVGCRWYTNIDIEKCNIPLDLYKRYSNEYPKYDTYDAIEVSKVTDIPMDYNGIMGVPISFLDKYCPEQFEIVGLFTEANGECFIQGSEVNTDKKHQHSRCPVLNKKRLYARIIIRKRNA